jgi:MFS-type transporter involved in bile tolerance (Atg22 family)
VAGLFATGVWAATFLVGLLHGWTGSYMAGFVVLGGLSVAGGVSLLIYGRIKGQEQRSVPAASARA